MYIIKNALKNIMRNKGRNILMGCIIFAIIATSVVALCIYNTSGSIIDDYKSRFGSEVSITPDFQRLMSQNGGGGPVTSSGGGGMTRAFSLGSQLTPAQYLSFADSQYIQKAIFTSSVSASGETLSAIDEDAENQGNGRFGLSINGQEMDGENFVMPTFRLMGGSVDEFDDGTRQIMDGGRMYENDGECVISSDLAELNGLSVGDVITLTANATETVDDEIQMSTITYELTITGIYVDGTDEYSGDMPFKNAFMNRRNEILTTFNTLLAPLAEGQSGVSIEATYYLNDPNDLSAYEAELREKGLSEDFVVSTDSASYNNIVRPVEGMRNIALVFMLIVLGLGAVILILLSSIAIRERKYEIGVLRAMGMKKSRVAAGLWTEMLALTMVCLILGLGVGMAVTQPVSDVLLKSQVEAAKESQNTSARGPGGRAVFIGGGGGFSVNGANSSDAQPLEELDVSLGMDTLGEMFLLAVLLASVAGMGAIMKITKYEPIKILMERT